MVRWINPGVAFLGLLALCACGSGSGGGGGAPACEIINAAGGGRITLQDLQVTIEVRFITMGDQFFEELGVDFDIPLADEEATPTDDGATNGSGRSGGVRTDLIGGVPGAFALVPQGQAGIQSLPIIHPDFVSPTPGMNITTNLGGGACVDFGGNVLQSLAGLDPVPGGQVIPTVSTPSGGSLMGAVLSNVELASLMQAVFDDATSEVLEAPQVALFDGQVAHVQAVTEIPMIGDLNPDFATLISLMSANITHVEAGPVVQVKPMISPDRTRITLRIDPALQMISARWPQGFQLGGTTASGVMVPVIKPRGVRTGVIVDSGETLVLGGTLDADGMTVTPGVPIFADLPLLQTVFRSHQQLDLRRNLIIMVTPTIREVPEG